MKITVKQPETSTYVYNDDCVFVCQHDGNTYIDFASTPNDPENSFKVTVCEDCDQIIEDGNDY